MAASISKLIGWFKDRSAGHSAIEPSIRAFEAASASGRWPEASNMPSLQAAIMFGRQRIGDRAEYLVANSPHAAGMTRALVSGIAGTGHLLNTRDPEIDRNFKRWSKRATVDGRSLASLQASVARDVVVRGEAFVVIRFVDGKILLQQIDPKQVDSSRSEELPGGSRIVAGVEIDTEGRRVAFWILPSRPGDPFAEVEPAKRVPADEVLHIFDPQTADQVRGISWFHAAATRLVEIDQLEDAQLVRTKIAAMLAGFARSTGGTNPLPEQNGSLTFEPGTISFLPPDADIVFSDPANVGDTPAFLKSMLKSVAASIGLSYELATGDLRDVNYSSYRAGHLEFRRKAALWQQELIVHRLLDPIYRRWALIEALHGRPIDLDIDAEWLAPPWGMIDPAKEIGAEISAVEARLKSRREVIASRGRDPDSVLAEIENDLPPETKGSTHAHDV